MPQTEPINPSDLQSLVSDTFLQSVVHFNQTDSTNSRAIDSLTAEDSVLSPYLIYAETQTAGRGRGANQWWSAPGSLTFSMIIDFNKIAFSLEQRPLLPLLTGMAILQAGQSFLPDSDFAVKWPNDVYLAGRKLAGVLIEVPSQSSHRAVIGVGLNVNNRFSHAPEELQSTGIALADVCMTDYDRLEVLRSFVHCFEHLVKSFAGGKSFLNQWPRHCLLTGKEVTLQTGSTEVTGLCQGVEATGALLLDIGTERKRFFGGVIKSWT